MSDLGYGNELWAEAIFAQAKKLGHTSNLFYTETSARLAEKLCKRTGMGVPYPKRGVNIISVAVDAPQETVSALSGKIGRLNGVTAKTVYAPAEKPEETH